MERVAAVSLDQAGVTSSSRRGFSGHQACAMAEWNDFSNEGALEKGGVKGYSLAG